MKAYIAGKITGDEHYQEKFAKAKQRLEAEGWTVISPAVLPEGMGPSDYMRICFAMMESADIIVFLPDWADSKGAQIEFTWAQYVSKQTYFLADTVFEGETREKGRGAP